MFRHYTFFVSPLLNFRIAVLSQNPANFEHEGNKRDQIILTNFMKFVQERKYTYIHNALHDVLHCMITRLL